ncbi:type II toxin-antitoxin system HipA family toxin [Parasegetibacter sp. MAH-26]|uniref:Type II toxin-antitoxin system HipA family toxin n=2 Tax=Pinibacter aurantiacus TaxID=2851599 RepID=A0A9E2SET8_9BACT|nr:type II toxin-antitoxin system HipA family toxin [Pinibacter aurantiacus]MBV4358810.1 type II toxin-antitoxin system HipA family toxin [Pinibacter aurantiacus]
MLAPELVGILTLEQIKTKRSFSFTYEKQWLDSKAQHLLDPDLSWGSGPQFPGTKQNFGVFLDSMPDTWGRTLMKRRAALEASEQGKTAPALHELDFLLGVHDQSRMGALRFKTDPHGDFLDNNLTHPTPPWTSICELQHGAAVVESADDIEKVKKWLTMLMAPGSSLGGARPKANVLDEHGQPWIAKFPSKNDETDKAAWEYLAYRHAVNAGIQMAPCKLQKIAGKYHTFFTQRFDREKTDRIHFASAMTMTGNNEEKLKDNPASYLDMAEVIQYNGAPNHIKEDLHQLWRRLVFNILISNTDDHLRNHGFLFTDQGWRLSPAFDINPSIDKAGLALNIDMDSNALDLSLARSVGEYFNLDDNEMNQIIAEVTASVSKWQIIAAEIGIPRQEQLLMGAAFKH